MLLNVYNGEFLQKWLTFFSHWIFLINHRCLTEPEARLWVKYFKRKRLLWKQRLVKQQPVQTLYSDKQYLLNCYTVSLELSVKCFLFLKILFNMNFTKKALKIIRSILFLELDQINIVFHSHKNKTLQFKVPKISQNSGFELKGH